MGYPYYPVEGTPYTDFHDLNLDWILQRVKEAYEAYRKLPEHIDASVREYMTSDAFLDALRDIIDEEFLTEAAEQAIKERLTVINVRDYGALGDGTDQDVGIGAAVAAFNADPLKTTIYFPAGTYRYTSGRFEIFNRDVELAGDHAKITPYRYQVGQDAYHSLFLINGGRADVHGFICADYEAPSYYAEEPVPATPADLDAVFQFTDNPEVRFHDNHINNWYIKHQRASYAAARSAYMEGRPALWFTIKGRGNRWIYNNEISGRIGGEELTVIASTCHQGTDNPLNPANFDKGNTWIYDNVVRDGDQPDTVNSLWGTYCSMFNAYGGNIWFERNSFKNWYYGGSVNNIMASHGIIRGNIAFGCTFGNLIDTAEEGRYINTDILIDANIVQLCDMVNLATTCSKRTVFSNNLFSGKCGLITRATKGTGFNTLTHGADVVPADPRDETIVSGNTMIYEPGSGFAYQGLIFIDRALTTEDANYTRLVQVSDNTVKFSGARTAEATAPPIRYMMIPEKLIIDGNRFYCAGSAGNSTTYAVLCDIYRVAASYDANAALSRIGQYRFTSNFVDLHDVTSSGRVAIFAIGIAASTQGTYKIVTGSAGNTIERRSASSSLTGATGDHLEILYTNNATDIRIT